MTGTRIAVALSAAVLAACGGGSSADNGSDATMTAASLTSGYAPVKTTPVTTTPVTTTGTSTGSGSGSGTSTSAPVGAVVTDVRVQNTGTAAQTNVPFTFGQAFPVGALKPTEGLVGKLSDGSTIALQVDVKATHADGSVRHAVISGVLPTLAATQTQTVQMAKTTLATAAAVTPQTLIGKGLTGTITVTIAGVPYTASLSDALTKATPTTWLAGSVADEWIGASIPLKDAKGNAHQWLTARFGVRWYPGLTNQARVEFIVENDKTFISNSKFTYDVNLDIGGKSVYAKTGLTHYNRARWHQYAWWDSAHQPNVNVQLNTAYLIASKAVSNYDQTATPSEQNLTDLYASISASNTGPMNIGPVTPYMPTTGGRPDIGSLPSWSVMWLLSQDKRARDVMMAAADGSGAWSTHLRDETTDYPVRTDNAKNATITTHGNLGTVGPLAVPRCVAGTTDMCSSPYSADTAHQPSLVYLPYLVTGDYYYLEELQFWASSNPLETDPSYNGNGQGLLRWQQVRGQAWSLRTLGQVAYITPDNNPLKAYFNTQMDNNLNYYNQWFVVGKPNNLGVYDGSGTLAFQNTSTSPWEDDFLTWSFGYLNDLGFAKALPILQWKAQYPVGRMTAPGYCWLMATAYNMTLFDSNHKVWNSFADLYNYNWGGATINFDNVPVVSTIHNGVDFTKLACNSQAQVDFLTGYSGYKWDLNRMVGYSDFSMGYPANMQPALAAAVTGGATDAAKAWALFQTRSMKPDYRTAPQWDILPR